MMPRVSDNSYGGFEQGPIRPPSEADSLLIRVTRNCPWNKCTFCPVYKGAKFSARTVADVKHDIDTVYRYVESLQELADESGRVEQHQIDKLVENAVPKDAQALTAAFNWVFGGGMKSVFLQDANSLVLKPADLVEILTHLRQRFPGIERITSYARSQTIARRSAADLRAIREAGLNRLHIGLESGCDEVLKAVQKGCTKQIHIDAGRKAIAAGFELSEYYMPGLGGTELSEQHALESADALSRIDPHFIRLRTLAIPHGAPLADEQHAGRFKQCTDVEVAHELLIFIENLDGIRSSVQSDHILNLFGDLEGVLPDDKPAMLKILRTFLDMTPQWQCLYQVGRRLGILSSIHDLDDTHRLKLVELQCRQLGITPDNVDEITTELARRYI
ncbi:MAG: radical SAM protein [Planctomycetota bacterium]